MMCPWSHRYRAVIVGRESGNRSPLTFITFRTYEKAELWCLLMNDSRNVHDGGGLTYYEPERYR